MGCGAGKGLMGKVAWKREGERLDESAGRLISTSDDGDRKLIDLDEDLVETAGRMRVDDDELRAALAVLGGPGDDE